jgi:hypothetical protein
MKTEHLTDSEIQIYSLSQADIEPRITEHISTCESCRAKAGAYRQLFLEIKELRAPAFDFNLSDLVLARLSKEKSPVWETKTLVYLTIFGILALLAFPAYLYREYLLLLFTGISAMFLYLTGITALVIFIFQSIEVYKQYQRKSDALNSF